MLSVDIWLRHLTSTELLALVRYGERLWGELGPMHAAQTLLGVEQLDDAWDPLRKALAEDAAHHVAPGIGGGIRLREGLWVILARDVQRAAVHTQDVPPELEAKREALAELYDRAATLEHHVIVHGVPDAMLPPQFVSAPIHQVLTSEVARLRRHLSLTGDRTLRDNLHRADAGLHSDDDGDRWRAFIDVGEVLVDPQRRLHPAALEELKALFIPLLSAHPGRHQAALLLGLIAEAAGHGGSAPLPEIINKLHRNLRIIGSDWQSGDWPGVLDEALPSARIGLVLCMFRVGFAAADVLAQVVPEAQAPLTNALAGTQTAYHEAMQLALDMARSGR